MFWYLGRRLLRAILLLWAVSVLSFCLSKLAPGDYFDELRLNPEVSAQTMQALRNRYEVGLGIPIAYARWLGSVVQGQWGVSIAYKSPVAPLLWIRARNTLLLTGTALLLGWTLAVLLALWASSGRRWRTLSVTAVVSGLQSIPDTLLVLVLLVLAGRIPFLAVGGMTSLDFDQLPLRGKLLDLASHLGVPCLALVLALLPVQLAHAHSALTETLEEPFVMAAKASGIPNTRLLVRHALRPAANPLITLLGLSVGTLLSSSLVVEIVVGWPGLGQALLLAILQRDLDVVVGAVMLSAGLFVLSNFVADLVLYVVDPRIREERR